MPWWFRLWTAVCEAKDDDDATVYYEAKDGTTERPPRHATTTTDALTDEWDGRADAKDKSRATRKEVPLDQIRQDGPVSSVRGDGVPVVPPRMTPPKRPQRRRRMNDDDDCLVATSDASTRRGGTTICIDEVELVPPLLASARASTIRPRSLFAAADHLDSDSVDNEDDDESHDAGSDADVSSAASDDGRTADASVQAEDAPTYLVTLQVKVAQPRVPWRRGQSVHLRGRVVDWQAKRRASAHERPPAKRRAVVKVEAAAIRPKAKEVESARSRPKAKVERAARPKAKMEATPRPKAKVESAHTDEEDTPAPVTPDTEPRFLCVGCRRCHVEKKHQRYCMPCWWQQQQQPPLDRRGLGQPPLDRRVHLGRGPVVQNPCIDCGQETLEDWKKHCTPCYYRRRRG